MKGVGPIAVVGAGRVGGALAALWHRAGLEVAALHSPGGKSARAAQRLCGKVSRRKKPSVVSDLGRAVSRGDVVVLAVPDDSLTSVCAALVEVNLEWTERTVFHTSGFHAASALGALGVCGAAIGALHPLQSVPSAAEGIERIPGCTFALDGDDDALVLAKKLAQKAGGDTIYVPEKARALYHAAAVLASNAVVGLLDAALEVMTQAGISEADARAALVPLVRGTVDNVAELSTGRALTGPVARGDVGTVTGHLEALARMPHPANRTEPSAAEIYKVLSRRMFGITTRRRKLTPADLKIAKRLRE